MTGPAATPADAAQQRSWTEEVGLEESEVGLLTRVVRLNMVVTQVLESLVEPHDVSISDFLVLASIRRGLSSPVELCRILGRTTGGMSLTIDRLVRAGWVERHPDPADRRRITVELTESGTAKAEQVNRALHAWEESMDLAGLDRSEVEDHLDEVTDLVTRHRP